MKAITTLLAGSAVMLGMAGCSQTSTDSLSGTPSDNFYTSGQAALHDPAPSHMAQIIGNGQNGITDPVVALAVQASLGTPDQVARMHAAQKIQYAMLGAFLTDLGATMTAAAATTGGKNSGTTATTAVPTVGQLYVQGSSALGAPIFTARTPEMIIPSTSALAKEFDIFMAAAPEIIANIGKSTRCPNVVLMTNGELTQDGISCLIGKPATADHVALAQQVVASATDPTTGQEIAVATLLAAAHISE
jgi:hypothetical protein